MANISGEVRDQAGQPVAGAVVRAIPAAGGADGVAPATAADGRYVIDNLADGAYAVRVDQLPGYADQQVDVAGADVPNIDFAAAAAPAPAPAPAPAAAGAISGTVLDQVGPVAGAVVRAIPAAGGPDLVSAASAADGTYAINNVPDDTYTVRVDQLPGYADQQVIVAGAAVPNIDFVPAPAGAGSISGTVRNGAGQAVAGVMVRAEPLGGGAAGVAFASANAQTANDGTYTIPNLADGDYRVGVDGRQDYSRRSVAVAGGAAVAGVDFSPDAVRAFLDFLGTDARFSLDSKVSEEEANQAVALFSVVTLMLAGQSRTTVAGTPRNDMLGVLTLYYGLQDNSLRDKFTFGNPGEVWRAIENDLRRLAQDLDRLQADLDFLSREAKRQFNLGLNNNVVGNVQFPTLFKRYVAIGNDPLLSFDIQDQDNNQFADRTKIAQADELLRELKAVTLQVVRSLSKEGTVATERVNREWALFQRDALAVLDRIGRERVTPDQDAKNPWTVLADLTGKNRDTEVAPYVVLARHGRRLLDHAMETYFQIRRLNLLDRDDPDLLRPLFQSAPRPFLTENIRQETSVVARFPLAGWG